MVVWDETTDKKLLLLMLAQTGVASVQWKEIASSMGEGATHGSVQKRYSRIKQQVEKGDSAATPKTGRGKKGGDGEKSAGSKRKSTKKAAGKEDAGDDNEEQTPSKKVKVKEEKTEDSDDDLV